jgi:hypothetical protein
MGGQEDRLYAIQINGLCGETFYVEDGCDVAKKMFAYCEKEFKFSGDKWEEIKEDYDYYAMGEMIVAAGGEYEECCA